MGTIPYDEIPAKTRTHPTMIVTSRPLHRMSLSGKPMTGISAFIALFLFASPAVFAQSAPVDEQSLKFHTDPAKSEVAVDFRLVEDTVAADPATVSVRATAAGVTEPLKTAWKPWGASEVPATAWLIIIDSSNPARQATVTDNAKVVQEFIRNLPSRDAFAIHELALGLEEVTPFGTPLATASEKVAGIRAEGDASLGTLIHQSVREGLKLLDERSEPRKAVLLLSDGKDETPGGIEAITKAQNQLIAKARESKVVIHTIGYAERADELVHFGQLRELSKQTGGLHVPAALRTRALPDGALNRFLHVMQGAGRAMVDVKVLKEVSPTPDVVLEVATESGRRTRITIPAEQVTAALTVPATVDEPEGEPEGPVDETVEEPEEGAGEGGGEEDLTGPTTVPNGEDGEEATETITEESGISPWIWLVLGLLVVVGVIAAMKIRAQNRRREEEALAAEEAARVSAERDEEDRKRAVHAEQTRKSEATKPLAWLEMCDDKQSRTPVTISSLKIGRGRHNDLVIRNDSVSGNHCVINLTREGVWTISDLQSGNGTMVNDQSITQVNLQNGDIIELGEMRMRFLIPS